MTALASLAAGGAGIALVAGWRERRRVRRNDPDAVGVIDWTGVQLAGLGMMAIAGLLALHA